MLDVTTGQAASALHSMAVFQVFQAKILASTDKSGLDPATLRELRSVTDLALCTTKATAQAIGGSMASLIDLWLTLTEIKDADKVPFLDTPVSPNAECFTEAQKLSRAMRHFLQKPPPPSQPNLLPVSEVQGPWSKLALDAPPLASS